MKYLLPETDAGVAIQAVITTLALASGYWITRNHRDGRIFVAGLTVMAIAAFGIRALH